HLPQVSRDGPSEEEGNHPQEQPCQDGPGVKPKGTGDSGSALNSLELPRFLEPGRQPGQRCGKLLHFQPNPVIGLPLDNLLDMTRPVPVHDADSGTDDPGGLNLKPCTLDARYWPVTVEFWPFRQVENLPGDVFGSQRQSFFTGEGDRFHS